MKTKKLTTMERIFIFIMVIIAVAISSCKNTVTQTELPDRYRGCAVDVLVIDSCEYITIAGGECSLTHKGNCKFCAERNKK